MELEHVKLNTDDLVLTLRSDDISIQALAFKSIAYVDQLIEVIKNRAGASDEKSIKLIDYIWSHEAKEVALLLRDGSLNLLKLTAFSRDGLRSSDDITAFQLKLSETILTATTALSDSLSKKLDGQGVIEANWIHELSPTTIVSEQLDLLSDQIKKIQRSERKLYSTAVAFADYRDAYIDHIDLRKERAQHWKRSLGNLLELFSKSTTTSPSPDIKKLITTMDQYIAQFENESILPSYEHIVLEDINRMRLPVASAKGQLVFKTIDALSEISGWVSFHIDPPLRTIDDQLLTYKDQVTLILFQISNRLKAKIESKDEDIVGLIEELSLPIRKLLKDFESQLAEGSMKQFDSLNASLQNLLVTSQFFNTQSNFLPSTKISMMAEETLRSNLEKRYQLPKIVQFLHQISGGIFEKYKVEEEISAASYISKMLNFDPNTDYNSLFLKKGFLGNSFTVERPGIQAKIESHYSLWQQDFCGALLISGGHNSGRSTVLERVPLMFADIKSHHIVRNQVLEINGHKHRMTSDLMETLKFIIKYQGTDRSIVTLDGLANYARTSAQLFDIFNELSEFIKKYVRKIYFVISIHEKLAERLAQYFNFDNIFTEVVRTEKMDAQLIEQAILIRARAVASIDQLEALESEYVEYARKVAKQCQGKIGYGMQLWCVSKDLGADFNMNQNFALVVLRHQSLLRTLVHCGMLNVADLMDMFTEVDARALRADIQALVQVRVVIRPEQGVIAIHPHLQSAVELILNKNK